MGDDECARVAGFAEGGSGGANPGGELPRILAFPVGLKSLVGVLVEGDADAGACASAGSKLDLEGEFATAFSDGVSNGGTELAFLILEWD